MNIDAFVYLDRLRPLLFALPEVTEGVSYGTPGFYVNKKLFARLREEGDILVVYTDEREKWMKVDSEVYFITEHYRNYPWMLVRLGKVKQKDLKILLQHAWELRAPKRLIVGPGKKTGKSGEKK